MSAYRLSITAEQAVKLRNTLKAAMLSPGFKSKDLPKVFKYVHVRPYSTSGKDTVDFTVLENHMAVRFTANDASASWGSDKVEAMLIETKSLMKLLSLVKAAHVLHKNMLTITWEMDKEESRQVSAKIAGASEGIHDDNPLVHKTNYHHGLVIMGDPEDPTWRWRNTDRILPDNVELGWDAASDNYVMSPEHHVIYGKIVGDDWQRSMLRYSDRIYFASLRSESGSYRAMMAFMGNEVP